MFEHITPENLKADALSKLTSWNTSEGSFADITVAGAMHELWKWYMALNSLVPMFYIDETSGEYIDRRCADYGIYRKPDESDAALVERYYAYLRKPATSGNAHHYEQWALETPGVGFVKVYPEWMGANTGTVKVLLAAPDGGAVVSDTVNAVHSYIETQRPIGATVTVESASVLAVNISASVTLTPDVTLSEITEIYESSVKAHLSSLTFSTYHVSYNRLLYLLLDVPGVADVNALTLNGGNTGVDISDTAVPVLGQLEVQLASG